MPSLRIPTTSIGPADQSGSSRVAEACSNWESAIRSVFRDDLLELVENASLPGLRDGPRDEALAGHLTRRDADELVRPECRIDVDSDALASSLWLLAGDLDRSHTISQDLASPQGSFLHGVMHRREGDFGNAQYWFRRARLESVETSVAALHPTIYANACDFVDAVKADWRDRSGSSDALIRAQWGEWIVLTASIAAKAAVFRQDP